MYFTLLLLVTIMLSVCQAFEKSITVTVEPGRVGGACADIYTKYATYDATVQKGALLGFYFTAKSQFDDAYKASQNGVDPTLITVNYQINASCPRVNMVRKTKCTIVPAVQTIPISEPYCILLNNINTTESAKVNIQYSFTSSSGSGSSDGGDSSSSPSSGSNSGSNSGSSRPSILSDSTKLSTESTMKTTLVVFVIGILGMLLF